MSTSEDNTHAALRVDRWLWAARWFKTRALAVAAIDNGRVLLNGERPKPAKAVHLGDTIEVRRPPYSWTVTVIGTSAKRVSAKLAAQLYEETSSSTEARERLKQQLSLQLTVETRPGKPNKKERRAREHLKRNHEQA